MIAMSGLPQICVLLAGFIYGIATVDGKPWFLDRFESRCLLIQRCIQDPVNIQDGVSDLQAERYGGYVMEEDMIMSGEDVTNIFVKKDLRPKKVVSSGGAQAEFSTTKYRYRWPGGVVPYESDIKCPFEKLFGTTLCWIHGASKEIKEAMAAWEKNTCIRFKKRTGERDYIRFINGGKGKCYSHVGRIGGEQVISIGHQCRKTGIVIHEIGHALGFLHEQSRFDRDQYVDILWDNIKEEAKANFRRYTYSEVDDQGFPYDYSSIMHYRDDAFVKRYPLKSIRPKRSNVKIGQRERLSDGDISEMNKFYGCPS